MFRPLVSIVLLFVLIGCATRTLVREEPVGVPVKIGVKQSSLIPTIYRVSFSEEGSSSLKINISKVTRVKSEWESTYRKRKVYEQKCRGWRGSVTLDIDERRRGPKEYCSMNWGLVILNHILGFGFLIDLWIPFQAYEEKTIEVIKESSELITKEESTIHGEISVPKDQFVTFEINDKILAGKLIGGEVVFSFKSLNFFPGKIDRVPDVESVGLRIRGQRVELMSQILAFDKILRNGKIAAAKVRKDEAHAKRVLKISKAMCGNYDFAQLLFSRYGRVRFKKGCVYIINSGWFHVLQKVWGGVLADLNPQLQLDQSKVFRIKTNENYVDSDILRPGFLKYIGTTSYITPFNVSKTVHEFKEVYF